MVYFISRQTEIEPQDGITRQFDLRDCLAYCEKLPTLGIDTETTGLNFLDDKLLTVQVGDRRHQFVIDCTTVDARALAPILENRTQIKVGHNLRFDYKFLKSKLGIELEHIWDTMLVEQVIHAGKESMRFGLDVILQRRLGVDMSKGVRASFQKFDGRFTTAQIRYAAADIAHMPALHRQQYHDDVLRLGLVNVTKLENNAALAFADIEYNGIALDREKWLQVAAQVGEKVDQMKAKLYDMIEQDDLFREFRPRAATMDLFRSESETFRAKLEKSFSWSSPKQVLALFWKVLPELNSVNAKLLELHKRKHPIIGAYTAYKEQEKLASAYGESFLEQVWSDGRVHTSFRQILNTGRVSSSKPNCQQIPADNTYRNAFVTGYDDWVFVSSDFSSQELCIIAEGSGDPVWNDALRTGQDLHSVCAELVYGEGWWAAAEADCAYYTQNRQKCDCQTHKKLRTGVKTINFGLA